jgi:hypothetical protein
MRQIETHTRKRVVDMALEFGIDTEGNVLLTN